MSLLQRLCFNSLILTCLVSTTAQAENWPGFLGATGRGVSGEKNLPETWSEKSGLRWATDLPGRANSSPVVTSDRIYLTSQTENKDLLAVALDKKSGKILWEKKLDNGILKTDGPLNLYDHRHNPATSTPAADEKHVWVFFGTGKLFCLDRDGNEVWSKDLVKEYGEYTIRFGMASSPRLLGNLLFVNCLTRGPSYVVAFDKNTGSVVWKQDRKLTAEHDAPDGYATPAVMMTNGGVQQLLIVGSDHINAYNPRTGKQLWISGGLTIDSEYGRVIASPAFSEDGIFVTSSNPGGGGLGHGYALKAGGKGDIYKSHKLWGVKSFSPDSPTPVIYQGKVFMVRDDGIGTCFELLTGKQVWRKRLGKGPFRASTVAGDGKIYFVNREGDTVVVAADDDSGKTIATNHLDDLFYSTPAISDGAVYLRGYKKLYAVGK